MSDCIDGSSSEAPSPPRIAQKMTIAGGLGEDHGQRADGVAEQPERDARLRPMRSPTLLR
jgi:hypothetical protein